MKINKVFLGFMSFFISILGSSSISINEATLDNVIYDFYSDDENILVKTWERGAGATYSCGTGCSASVVICNKLNLTKDKVNVRVPGGQLRIELEGTSIYMIGDAEFICSGKAY